MFNKMQRFAYRKMLEGGNIFLTGKAGVGKSYVLRKYIEATQKSGRNIVVTASTGIAALNIDGVTAHRAFKIPIEPLIKDPKESDLTDCVKKADVIILEEVSMCRFDLFGYIAKCILLANKYRANNLKKPPIQFIVVGDFFQLPPVVTDRDRDVLETYYGCSIGKAFAFMSSMWKHFNFTNILLDEVVRQTNIDFINNLNLARVGLPKSLYYFSHNSSQKPLKNAIMLCGTNKDVKSINEKEIAKLYGKSKTYEASITGDVKQSDMNVDKEIEVKEGARVMFVINDTEGKYVNGTFGTIKRLNSNSIDIIVDDTNELVTLERYTWEILDYKVEKGKLEKIVVGRLEQFPIKLAYAITIHKSQGQTYSKVNINPYCWDCGQLYVALSRATSIEKIHFTSPLMSKYLIASNDVNAFYRSIFGNSYI